jgi:hypothetical protein
MLNLIFQHVASIGIIHTVTMSHNEAPLQVHNTAGKHHQTLQNDIPEDGRVRLPWDGSAGCARGGHSASVQVEDIKAHWATAGHQWSCEETRCAKLAMLESQLTLSVYREHTFLVGNLFRTIICGWRSSARIYRSLNGTMKLVSHNCFRYDVPRDWCWFASDNCTEPEFKRGQSALGDQVCKSKSYFLFYNIQQISVTKYIPLQVSLRQSP